MSDAVKGPYINHPIVIVKNLTITVLVLAIIAFGMVSDGGSYMIAVGMVALIALLAFFIVMFWKTTSIEFGDQDFTVRRNFISRKTKVVPYYRVASVNITRNIFDRIAGTETLSFNVNSSVNAATPEACFSFKKELADEIRDYVYSRTFHTGSEVDRDEEHESVVSFTPAQVVVHSIISQPTWQIVWAGIFLAIAVVSIFMNSSGGLMVGILMFAVQEVIPVVSVLLRYFGFRMYRDEDTICLQYGALHNYRTEFDVAKINAIRLRRPLLARMIHRSCLEAEVVGIDATSTATPMLCLLMPDAEAEALIKKVLPEFDCEIPEVSPPKAAWKTMLCQAVVFDAILVTVAAWPCWTIWHMDMMEGVGDVLMAMIRAAPVVLTILTAAYAFWRGWRSYLLRRIGLGEDKMVMRNGLLDREWVMIQYDRIQISKISGDLISRHFGVSHCTVCLLSTTGSKSIKSGYFPTEYLEEVPAIVQARIDDGRYDPEKNPI